MNPKILAQAEKVFDEFCQRALQKGLKPYSDEFNQHLFQTMGPIIVMLCDNDRELAMEVVSEIARRKNLSLKE